MADILVVDDEENLSYSIQLALRRSGHDCRVADTVESGLEACLKQVPDLVLADVQLPDGEGLELIGRLQAHGLDVPVIVVTSFGTVATAVQAMKQGALDFLQKPLSMEELCLTVDRCLEHRRIRNQLDAYRHAQRRESDRLELIGRCSQLQQVVALADKIALVPGEPGAGLVTTLITGETGTGKEVIARLIHNHSRRPDRPFVQVNCTAIPENLFEAELFGHERGTFTDAKSAKKGLLEMAHEGSLFLDEIGDMPLSTQAKLLVAIETGRFRRLGATSERVVEVRVLVATNSDLERKVHAGEFRADLYYRLKMFCVTLPPLRERGDDLFLLAEHFIGDFSRKFHKPPPALPAATREVMRRYPWPGNVRELAHVLQRAVLVSDGSRLEAALLGIDRDPAPTTAALTPVGFDFSNGGCTLAAVEKRLIESALKHTGGNISETARLLGLTRGGLRHRMDKLGVADKG